MIRIIICEDNYETAEKYKKLICRCGNKHDIMLEILHFSSGEALLFYLAECKVYPDIIYMDVIMHQINGIETARKLRERGVHSQIIFLSSFRDFVFEAFDVSAIQYLVKDEITLGKFEETFLRACKLAEQKDEELFVFEYNGMKYQIPIARISHFEIWKRLVTVHYGEGMSEKFYSSMDSLEQHFKNQNFVRVHRSYLVHLSYIERMQSNKLTLRSGAEIPMGVTYAKEVKKKFSEYLARRCIYEPDFVKVSGEKR